MMERYANKQNLMQLSKAVHDKYSVTATTSSAGLMSASDKEKLDGIVSGGITELSAKGWAEQDTTTGKNLSGYVYTFTGNGLNIIYDGSSVTLSGTATGNTYVPTGATAYDRGFMRLLPAGTYTLSTSTLPDGVNVTIVNKDGTQLVISRNTPATFTLSSDTYACHRVNIDSGVTVNTVINIQLELGSTATEYEPYTGGAPSPNPDYPQEIRVARGRNLYDETETPYKKDYVLASNGNENTAAGFLITQAIPIKGGATYSVSANMSRQTSKDNVRVGWYTSDMTFISRNVNVTTFIAPANAAYARLSYCYSVNAPSYTYDVQLEEDSTPSPYVPYGYVGMEAQGENLSGIVQNFAIAGNASTGYTLTSSTSTSFKARITKNTDYTVTDYTEYPSTMGNMFRIVLFKSEPTEAAQVTATEIVSSPTINPRRYTFNSGDYEWFAITLDYGTYYADAKLMLNEGTTALPYEPYYHSTTPIPLPSRGWVGSLPDGTADVLTLDGAGKVTWEEKTDEVVFDGNEAWAIRNSGKLVGIAAPSNVLPAESTIQVFNAYCTHFTAGSVADTWDGNQSVSTERATQTDRIRFADGSGSMTVESWVAWLASNPVTVLYPLATPVTEDAGYIEMPEIPVGAELRIPELDDLGVRYCVDGAASTLAHQYYNRAKSEYEDRIERLELAVAQLIAEG